MDTPVKSVPYRVRKSITGTNVRFKCPNCRTALHEKLQEAGKTDSCPNCGTLFVVPGARELAKANKLKAAQEKQANLKKSKRAAEKKARETEKAAKREQGEAIELEQQEQKRVAQKEAEYERKQEQHAAESVRGFQINERIATAATQSQVLDTLESQFKPRADSVQRPLDSLYVKSIDATFGSINRSDMTQISARQTNDGFLIVATVRYRPSLFFWVFFIASLFTYVGWLIPLGFYLYHKKIVKDAIQDCFHNVKNELDTGIQGMPVAQELAGGSAIADLERLGGMLQQGLITQQEFDSQKAKLLGTPIPTNPAPSKSPQTPNQSAESDELPNDEDEAHQLLEHARECVKDGHKDHAVKMLKDLIDRFPNTHAAATARKSLASRVKKSHGK